MRLEIVHTTRCRYAGPARASYNEVRMTPPTLPAQTVLETSLTVEPASGGIWRYRDHWGTLVSSFDIQPPHAELAVTARAIVDTQAAAAPPESLAWPELRERAGASELAQYLSATPRTTVTGALAAEARDRVAGAAPRAAAAGLAAWVRERVAYVPGATEVQTSAQEAWDKGQGVCQDIAQLSVALLRLAGLPARYVSGYLHPDPDPAPGRAVAGQSHAWVEYWAGGWAALDPANDAPVGERHVVVARGRDYNDVPPLKGVYHGPAAAMTVSVELARIG